MKVKELTDSFNSSLLDPESVVPPSTINNDNQSDDEEDETITVPSNKDYNYYQSTEWKEFVETELLDINITQPQIPHKSCQQPTEFTPLKQRRCTFCKEPGHNRSKCRLLKFDMSRTIHTVTGQKTNPKWYEYICSANRWASNQPYSNG
jgi:hypothetical protein